MESFLNQNKIAAYIKNNTFHSGEIYDLSKMIQKYENIKDKKPWDIDENYKVYDNAVFNVEYYHSFLTHGTNKKRDWFARNV